MFWNIYNGMMRFIGGIEYSLIGGDLFLTSVRSKLWHHFTNPVRFYLYFACLIGSIVFYVSVAVGMEGSASGVVFLLLVLGYYSAHSAAIYDFDVIAAFWKDYKQSSYHLATGVTRKELYRDAGLQGEFKAYVLSRQLDIPHRILYNVCVPMKNGNFQEVDAVIITENLIYAIECKNRGGLFKGAFDEENWVQYIGSQEHPTKNIYLQNEKHVLAIEQLLLESGLVTNGRKFCLNVTLRCGTFTIDGDGSKTPGDWLYGNNKYLIKAIKQWEAAIGSCGDTNMMEAIYSFLLPYSLYTRSERSMMMKVRNQRAENKEFTVAPFKTAVIPGGIPHITDPGEDAVIRTNGLYTQIRINSDNKGVCWMTRTDIPAQYKNMCR